MDEAAHAGSGRSCNDARLVAGRVKSPARASLRMPTRFTTMPALSTARATAAASPAGAGARSGRWRPWA